MGTDELASSRILRYLNKNLGIFQEFSQNVSAFF